MFNLTTTALVDFPRELVLLHENVTSKDLYISLAAVFATLCLSFVQFWYKRTPTTSHDDTSTSASSREADPLENVDYANIKVTKLLIHPIKSCRGTSVLEAEYTEEGLVHDRKLAIIDAKTHRIITARELPQMVLIYPQLIVDKLDQHGGRIHISFPDESGFEQFSIPLSPTDEVLRTWKRLDNIELFTWSGIDGYVCQSIDAGDRDAPTRVLSKYLGKDVYLVLKGPRVRPCPPTYDFPALKASASYQDAYPLLVVSEESLVAVQTRLRGEVGNQGVADRWGTDNLVMERFRPNIVLAGAGVPWAEDTWETIRIGENTSTITLVSKCTRCLLPNVDPETGVRDQAIPYKVLMKFRTGKDPARLSKPCFGCNGVPTGPGAVKGIVRIGDALTVVKTIIQRQK
ncbi:uncharacterized protein FOMMEDRAFT_95832 [Fomitiporia mediterranea MF3/22]|uniref:uncharacterized protein n=1 Tax=Fomitiporia mediterranea (strain MF3/22) TaxID=694068 RepID=UPI000440925A|nr:uncharacterized protein FOMMEDRAFT_95832 [Fomitiporia mediterranea MF3/22]EJC98824.1 hypothetical protein FOMMEDRAFT_95832 [Fomitiporia mediterranea MF3/22]